MKYQIFFLTLYIYFLIILIHLMHPWGIKVLISLKKIISNPVVEQAYSLTLVYAYLWISLQTKIEMDVLN